MSGYFYRRLNNGCTYRFRENKDGFDIDVKLNDAYARLAGHSDLGDLLSNDSCLGFEKLIELFGKVPKYLPLKVNGVDSDTVAEGKKMMRFYGEANNENNMLN